MDLATRGTPRRREHIANARDNRIRFSPSQWEWLKTQAEAFETSMNVIVRRSIDAARGAKTYQQGD